MSEPINYAKNLSDKFWRMNNLYKVIDEDAKLVTFKMRPEQKKLFDCSHPRYIIPKSRQLGITTYHVIYMLDDVLFKPNYTAVLQAHEREAMEKIFQKAQLAWQEFPKELKRFVGWEEMTDNKNTLRFNNYSSFSTTLSSRGGTVNHLHISEMSKIEKEYPEKVTEIRTGSFPSVVPNGKITIESTVEMPTGYFVDLFNQGFDTPTPQITKKDFQRFFFPWQDAQKYKLHNPALLQTIPQRYREYQREHNLSDDQITWYYSTQRSDGLTDQEMRQQFPTTLEEAFSSNIESYFSNENIKQRQKQDITPPINIINGWKIYEPFNKFHRYALAADPAEGIGKDHSAAVIIDFSHKLSNYQTVPKVVATFKSNSLDPVDFARELENFAPNFGIPILACELNNHGHTVIATLKETYPNLYKQVVKDYVENKERDRYGWLTTSSTKPEILSNLRQAINDFGIIIPDEGVLKELEFYGLDDYKRIKNDPLVTNHFDMVMALAICWEMRHYASEGYNTEPEYVTAPMDHNSKFFQV